VNFYDDGFNADIRQIVAVIKTGRIKAVAKVSKVGQQADGALRPVAEALFNEVPNGTIEGQFRISEMISAAKTGHVQLLM
jgi:hypothetical protein